ncbi:MAG: 50S ribosomal protein L14 [Rickettsiaceae bacterium H1]|nr:50S ribosomal protein L14 [Rickettsiaceae bacterium H1]
MIQCETLVKVADNSGAQEAGCIKVLSGKKSSGIGDVIVVSVRKAIPRGKVKAGQIYKAIVVRAKKKSKRSDHTYISFNDNAVVLVNDKFELIGSRVFGMVSGYQLRSKKFNRILSLAEEVL